MEVEFRVESGNRKLAAYEVCTLEPGSIVWEIEDEPGKSVRISGAESDWTEAGSGGPNPMALRILRKERKSKVTLLAASACRASVRFTANDFAASLQRTDGGDDAPQQC
jgi:hypothetical protein